MCLSLAACQVSPEELTLVYNLRKLMRNDWVRMQKTPLRAFKMNVTYQIIIFSYFHSPLFPQNGGAIITTLSQTGSLYTPNSAYLPQELLGKVKCHLYSIILSSRPSALTRNAHFLFKF